MFNLLKKPYSIRLIKSVKLINLNQNNSPALFLAQQKHLTKYYGTFNYKDFQFDKSHGESGTLIHRFVKYIAFENCKLDPLIENTISFPNYYPVYEFSHFKKSLQETPNNQMPKLIIYTFAYKPNAEFTTFTNIINSLDDECCKRLSTLTCDEMLRILYSFYYLLPNKIVKLQFYKLAMEKIIMQSSSAAGGVEVKMNDSRKSLRDDEEDDIQDDISLQQMNKENNLNRLTKFQFVQCCFYLGLWKKNQTSTGLLKQLFNTYFKVYLNDLTNIDFNIISNVSYKIALPIPFEPFYKRLQTEVLSENGEDPALLINLIKSCRQNRIQSNLIKDRIIDLVLNDNTNNNITNNFDARGFVHLYAYFADNFYNIDKINNYFIKMFMLKVSDTTNRLLSIRPKDVSTFLWSCSNLNVQQQNLLSANDLSIIEEIILEKIYNNDYKYQIDDLINACLSLWMLNHKSLQIIEYIFNNNNINDNFNTNNPERVKIDSRRKLLHSCIDIENPDLIKKSNLNLNQKNAINITDSAPKYLLPKLQTNLFNVYTILDDLKNQQNSQIKECTYVRQIKDLNICGILIQLMNGTQINVEVLDDTNLLSDGVTPFGLMELKLRLLKCNPNHNVIVVSVFYQTFSLNLCINYNHNYHDFFLQIKSNNIKYDEIKDLVINELLKFTNKIDADVNTEQSDVDEDDDEQPIAQKDIKIEKLIN